MPGSRSQSLNESGAHKNAKVDIEGKERKLTASPEQIKEGVEAPSPPSHGKSPSAERKANGRELANNAMGTAVFEDTPPQQARQTATTPTSVNTRRKSVDRKEPHVREAESARTPERKAVSLSPKTKTARKSISQDSTGTSGAGSPGGDSSARSPSKKKSKEANAPTPGGTATSPSMTAATTTTATAGGEAKKKPEPQAPLTTNSLLVSKGASGSNGMKPSIRSPSPPIGPSVNYPRSLGAVGSLRNTSSSNNSLRPNNSNGNAEVEKAAVMLAEHGFHLSNRAIHIVQYVEEVVRRCQGKIPNQVPSNEDLAMCEAFETLGKSDMGPLFVCHPEVALSIRACILVTPCFYMDDVVEGYQTRAPYVAGTIGCSYYAVKEGVDVGGGSSDNGYARSKAGSEPSNFDNEADSCIFKIVNFVLRKPIIDAVVSDQRNLVNFNYVNVLRLTNVLIDEVKENIIVISRYHAKSNISAYAGALDDDPDKLLRIIHEVAVGLRVLHLQKIYHHNLKLTNVLETKEGHYCIADAGFSRLFTSQCPEALGLNGELASLPPEVFDPNGRYANVDPEETSGYSTRRGSGGGVAFAVPHRSMGSTASQSSREITATHPVALVDIWGFGVLMYRLAYGKDPIMIGECIPEEICRRVRTSKIEFPKKNWPFAAALEDAILWCLEREPSKRPDILRLLRHALFKDSMAQSFSSPRAMVSSAGNPILSTSMSAIQHQHLQLGTSTKVLRLVQNYGYVPKSRIDKGSGTTTLLVQLKRNPSQNFAFKFVQSVLKRLQKSEGDSYTRDIIRQLATSKKFKHPNVVKYIDIVDGQKEGTSFVVQEYFPDGSLAVMPPIKSKNSENLQLLLTDVLSGLAFLHDNQITHLSNRPSNIFFDAGSRHYKVTDYGPSFLTVEDIMEAEEAKVPIYALPDFLKKEEPLNGYHLDMFTLGLLAASVVPEVYDTCWDRFTLKTTSKPLDIPDILAKVKAFPGKLSSKLVDLITTLLTTTQTAREVMKHPYFSAFYTANPQECVTVSVTEDELKNAVQRKPETHDELRLLDILGADPLQDTATSLGDVSSDEVREKSSVLVSFSGSNLRCGMCNAELIIALYRCNVCENYIRCGKCALNDSHIAGHRLSALIIYSIEHAKDEQCRATLIPPTTITDAHALETLEMKANLPAGSLTEHIASQRAMERSMARSMMIPANVQASVGNASSAGLSRLLFNQNSLNFKQFGGTELPSIMESDCSTSTLQTREDTSIKVTASSAAGESTDTNSPSVAPLLKSTKYNLLGSTPFPPAKNTLLKNSSTTVRKLPKAEDLDEGTWQQELKLCRDKETSDLLLFNYEFYEIPKEVYTPPPLHVTYLDLSQNHIREVPHELSLLVHLVKLVLSYNNLVSLPDSLGNLSELETLDLSHNNIDDLPSTFIYLTSLESLAMDYNSFSCVPECVLDIKPGIDIGSFASASSSAVALRGNGSFATSAVIGMQDVRDRSPRLSALFMAANDRLMTFPDVARLQRFDSLKLAFDNEPTLYKYFIEQDLERKLPNVTFNWNKIYPDEIVPFLYCGSLRSAQSQMVYEKLKISYVLTVGRGLMPLPPEGGKHKTIIVDDIPGADILSSFEEAINFIDESQRRGSGCLVHCFAGLSRSATTVIAYLMVKKKMRLDEAYALAKKGRPAILPNRGFFEQLLKLDKQLFPKDSKPLDPDAFGRTDILDLL